MAPSQEDPTLDRLKKLAEQLDDVRKASKATSQEIKQAQATEKRIERQFRKSRAKLTKRAKHR